jgi:hypothetical protein
MICVLGVITGALASARNFHVAGGGCPATMGALALTRYFNITIAFAAFIGCLAPT